MAKKPKTMGAARRGPNRNADTPTATIPADGPLRGLIGRGIPSFSGRGNGLRESLPPHKRALDTSLSFRLEWLWKTSVEEAFHGPHQATKRSARLSRFFRNEAR